MSVSTRYVTISHRYFARRSKDDLRRHIGELVRILALPEYDHGRLFYWNKSALAREAMRLHGLLPEDAE